MGIRPCGVKTRNGFGLYDMHGNAWEWCADGKRTYKDQEETDPEGPRVLGRHDDPRPVIRGGGWDCDPRDCRAARRNECPPGSRQWNLGFRVLVSP
jgi:formylglycine-generating enzyme required for sulfatase activity